MNKIAINIKAKAEALILNSEYRSVKLQGVSCSRSDLEMIVMYADTYIRNGNFNGFMPPRGNVKAVFDKINLK